MVVLLVCVDLGLIMADIGIILVQCVHHEETHVVEVRFRIHCALGSGEGKAVLGFKGLGIRAGGGDWLF
jgi:hypothetical protein